MNEKYFTAFNSYLFHFGYNPSNTYFRVIPCLACVSKLILFNCYWLTTHVYMYVYCFIPVIKMKATKSIFKTSKPFLKTTVTPRNNTK